MIHDAKAGNPSIVNYVMFAAVFAALSLIYLIAATISNSFAINPLFMVIADALNVLFFLIGGIALAAKLRVHSCGNDVCSLGFRLVLGLEHTDLSVVIHKCKSDHQWISQPQ